MLPTIVASLILTSSCLSIASLNFLLVNIGKPVKMLLANQTEKKSLMKYCSHISGLNILSWCYCVQPARLSPILRHSADSYERLMDWFSQFEQLIVLHQLPF
jgi:hypothetical protein